MDKGSPSMDKGSLTMDKDSHSRDKDSLSMDKTYLTMDKGSLTMDKGSLTKDRLSPPMERIFSAPRLSFSSQDVFNLRNHNLSQLSRSAPGIYSPQRKGQEFSQMKTNLTAGTPPKSILVKSRESIPEPSVQTETDEKISNATIRLELEFTVFVFFCFMLVIVIPSAMVIVGFIYLYSCQAEPMIPIFLVVGGSTFLATILMLRKLKKVARESFEDETCFKRFFLVAVLFHLGWFIAGCYWIYGAYEPNYIDKNSLSYCNKVLYLFSFWFLNSIFLSLSLFATTFTIYVIFAREYIEGIESSV